MSQNIFPQRGEENQKLAKQIRLFICCLLFETENHKLYLAFCSF